MVEKNGFEEKKTFPINVKRKKKRKHLPTYVTWRSYDTYIAVYGVTWITPQK